MNEENLKEINKMFQRIEIDRLRNSCGFEFADNVDATFDNMANCYDDRLFLYNLAKKYQNNWNELKKWIGNRHDPKFFHQFDLIEKMQELEGDLSE